MSGNHGKFVWYDLMTTDPEAAASFYSRLIGWEARDSGMTHQKYTLLLAGDTMVAGVMGMPEGAAAMGAKPGWSGHIAVDDVDACAAKIAEMGGQIHRGPEDIPGIGRFAVAADPGGATFMIFKGNTDAPPAAAPGTPGHIGWCELHAADGARAWEFYQGIFHWTNTSDMDMGPMGVYRMFAPAGETSAIGGMMTKMAQTPAPFWQYYFNVDAAGAAVERAESAGGKLISGPMEVPGGQWIAEFLDPQGAACKVVSYNR